MYKFRVRYEEENYLNDFNETVRSFYPYATTSDDGDEIILTQSRDGNFLESSVQILQKNFKRRDYCIETDEILVKRYQKRYLKLILYSALSALLGVSLPWGSLTGIRPTKLAYDLKNSGVLNPTNALKEQFFVSHSRAKLLEDIMCAQEGIYNGDEKSVDLYINIPFCVSRCSYCSFVSALTTDKERLLLPYAKALHKEIDSALDIIKNRGYNLRAIYCGGGTPTAFSAKLLKEVFSGLTFNAGEFTVECGRPDTIEEEKLDYLASVGVNRISINPQTFNQSVLDEIGRRHSVDEIYKSYELARNYPFRINMDLIADLPTDTAKSFLYSIDECIKLSPDNITVHALSIKHSSKMQADNYDNRAKLKNDMIDAVDEARSRLYDSGYLPYYMYRQKNTSGNLENIGYSKPNAQCVYNIDIMEENTSIISCGAGGISKRVFFENGRIERQNIVKNIEQYLREIDVIIAKKGAFFN